MSGAQPYSAEREALRAELASVKVELARLMADLDRRLAGARAAGYAVPAEHVNPG